MAAYPTALTLHQHEFGNATHENTVVIVHGLFGSGTNWRSLAKALAGDYNVITADCRNHGHSPWSDEHSYPAMAADLAKLVNRLKTDGAIIIGHSMGGKAAMDLALTAPLLVKALIVVDIAPVRYRHSHEDFINAMQAVPLDSITSRREADKILSQNIVDDMVRQFLLQNLVKKEGGFDWRVNLPVLSQSMDTMVDFPMTESGRPYSGPTLFIRGSDSDYVDPIRHDEIIHALFPNYTLETIDDAGHWLHAEKPKDFLSRVQGFLTRSDL